MNDKSALDRLHELFEENPLEENMVDHDEDRDAADIAIDGALSSLDLSFLPVEAQELLLGLTETASSLEPRTRQLFLEASDRALKRRREDASPLPQLLFLTRNRENETVQAVAESLSTDSTLLRDIERGALPIEDLGPAEVAAWVNHLQVPASTAIDALRATLLATSASRAAAAASTQLSEEQNKFVDAVAAKLAQT